MTYQETIFDHLLLSQSVLNIGMLENRLIGVIDAL